MRNRVYVPWVLLSLLAGTAVGQDGSRTVTLDDLNRLRTASDPQISPEGEWVAYSVSTPDASKDQADRDIWMTSWDGRRSVRLTTSKTSEHAPRWSPDGQYLAFLSSREDAREVDQVWLLNRTGGEAERIIDLPGGVSEYVWSPDGKRLALIASDPDPDSATVTPDTTKRTPRPIVIDRFQFKADEKGYLGYGTDQYVREYEAELGTPWRNTGAYLKVSYPFLHADRIVTPTLFLCGEKDFNVPLINSEQMYQALRSLGRETQLVIYPGESHDIRRPSYRRDRLQRYVDWYDRHLKTQTGNATH